MYKYMPYIIISFMSFSLTGCVVGYKSFSMDRVSHAQQSPSLEHIKLACTSDAGSEVCDSIQYALRTKYHIFNVQTIGPNEADRFRVIVNYTNDKSKKGETWAAISGLTLAIIPAVLSESHIYRFTISSPWGESKTYDYQFTERTYSWLPLFVFTLFVPGYYEDVTGLNMDAYTGKRRGIIEDSIIPRLMNDAGPFLLSQTTRTMK